MFIQDPLLLDGRDGLFNPVEEFICYLCMAPDVKGGVDKARADIFKKERKSWIIYHQHLTTNISYMLYVRIINPRYGCTLICSVFNHLLVILSHLVDGYL